MTRGKRERGEKKRARRRTRCGGTRVERRGTDMQIPRKRDTRELLSYVSQNYKTLILELLKRARARASLGTGKKKGDQRRLRVIVTLFTRSASNCLSLRESGGVCTPLDPWFRRRDGRLRRESGATQRETLDESAMAHPRSPAEGGKAGVENGPRGDAGTRWDSREERTRWLMTRVRTRKGTTGSPARVGMERSWVQRFLRDVGG